jgi:hypothetical protein
MTRSRLMVCGLLLTSSLIVGLAPTDAPGCPFCSAPSLTLTEQYAKADAAVLVEWVSGVKPKGDQPGSTTFRIVEVTRTPFKSLDKGKEITIERYRAAKKGDLSVLLGSRTKGELIEWGAPLDVTEAVYRYIVEAPSPEATPEKRLGYFVKFLEYGDPLIANDAYAEFANAPYKDIVPLANQFPRENLRKWIANPETSATRLGLYGLMLGLCGTDEDVALMEKKIVDVTEEYRLGIDGVMGGYLLLAGEKGLETIEKTKLLDRKVVFGETYAAMQALRFLWTYGNGRISAERLRASMRLLLDRPDVADLVITDLARWKDWSIQPRLMEIYGTEEYNVPSIKRAVIRFMIASTKDVPSGGAARKMPQHATDGAQNLAKLREKDPKMVSEAERFFYLN